MLFLGVFSTMSLNHHRDLTLNYAFQPLFKKAKTTNQKTNITNETNPHSKYHPFPLSQSCLQLLEGSLLPFAAPAEMLNLCTLATTTGQLYRDILKFLCMLRNQMLPLPL